MLRMIKLQSWTKIIANFLKMFYFLQFYNIATFLQIIYMVHNKKDRYYVNNFID